MHFGCVELVEQHGSTYSTRLARHVRHDERDRRDLQLSLLCNLYKVMICNLFSNLLEYTLIWCILLDGTNSICVCKSIKTTKLVQASTIACSSSAMLELHGSTRSTRSSRLARQSRMCRVVSRRAKWNLGLYVARQTDGVTSDSSSKGRGFESRPPRAQIDSQFASNCD